MFERVTVKLRALFRKAQAEQELDEELQYHLNKDIERNIARGMTYAEARRAALRGFGGLQQIKEQSRDARGVRLLEDLWHDLRYSTRSLIDEPGFTLVVVLMLALGT